MAVIKSVIDLGVTKGIFASADEVVIATNCYNAISQRMAELESMVSKIPQ